MTDIRSEVYNALAEIMFHTGASKEDMDEAIAFFQTKFYEEIEDDDDEQSIDDVKADVAGRFWTREDEMIEDLEDLGYVIVHSCGEFVDVTTGTDSGFVLYLGHARNTIWIETVRKY